MKDWIFGNLEWLVLGFFFIWFMLTEFPRLVMSWRGTSKYGDDDPSGNDNARPRKPYDYL
ncbi:hypothetical protein DRW41_21990 [Neobacillus piezotolerans]|uniref:Uncharacterized protein n=1 Tax=Neobacillus piezotolerans TaxID=2259171 RepID=A0A3D8GKB9_9BACI|nr:hypothetical protein [Neobacillus piezotolerans]RDU34699.1 hypothetical protein DRW41_21990 [Neobacillus piezotolerans]